MRFLCVPATSLVIALGLAACSESGPPPEPVPSISADSLLHSVRILSDDSMGGRGPGTPFEDKVVRYLTSAFERLGLEPGNPDGTWTQAVAVVGFTPDPTAEFQVGRRRIPLRYRTDYVAGTRREAPVVESINSELVFVGYGVEAPEYHWDDFKSTDLTGKTVVILVNDPPVRDARDSTVLDTAIFRGNAMTYYGRWTYKYEEASRRGAAAAIIVHQTGPAGYPWDVVSGSWGAETMDVRHRDGNAGRVAVEAWITEAKARELFKAGGHDFDALAASARLPGFAPVPLGATATFRINNAVRTVDTRNVVAKLAGTDPSLRNEYVIFTAHWDHLGIGQPVAGDSIYNGALDNATGVAALLELARAYKGLDEQPRRTMIFMAVTAEEKGLLGARYYVGNPLYPLTKTLANFNIDGFNQWGPTSDVTVIGLGNSTLDDILGVVAGGRQRTLSPDSEPEKGFYFRSDHFEFAKQGVPAMYLEAGTKYIGKPEGFGKQKRDEYTNQDYHQPSDEVKANWDLRGAVADLGLLFEVGRRVANDSIWPTWKAGTEFKSIRDSSLAKKQ
ncbi:MAG: M28 family metallopeptidase [Gemmatimonadales bacterium]